MTRHMRVQAFATDRNSQAEIIVDHALRLFVGQLSSKGQIAGGSEPRLQEGFSRDDCSDVFDHYLELSLKSEGSRAARIVHLWGQTTCYKGNQTNAPEPNKTYEIRETLVEALTLRRCLSEEDVVFRTFHVTFGPQGYAYGWFADAKTETFDFSIYPAFSVGKNDVYGEAAYALTAAKTRQEARAILDEIVKKGKTPIAKFSQNLVSGLIDWVREGMPVSKNANRQAALLSTLKLEQARFAVQAVQASKKGGADIKSKAKALMLGKKVPDVALRATVSAIFIRNPFLREATDALQDWEMWASGKFRLPTPEIGLGAYISHLWTKPMPELSVIRRMLLRVNALEGKNYIQDVGVLGLSEHNLYSGKHTLSQVKEMTSQIRAECPKHGIKSAGELCAVLRGKEGRRLVASALFFESKNGTSLKPSFLYVEQRLKEKYVFKKPQDLGLPPFIGYHANLTTNTVRPYENMKVVCRKSRGEVVPVAILKAKYFREPEFPRRAKEEAYVAITARHNLTPKGFADRYPGLPFVMFVDMDLDLIPPEYAVRRLVNFGWRVYFSIDELMDFLDSQPSRRSSE